MRHFLSKSARGSKSSKIKTRNPTALARTVVRFARTLLRSKRSLRARIQPVSSILMPRCHRKCLRRSPRSSSSMVRRMRKIVMGTVMEMVITIRKVAMLNRIRSCSRRLRSFLLKSALISSKKVLNSNIKSSCSRCSNCLRFQMKKTERSSKMLSVNSRAVKGATVRASPMRKRPR